MVFGVAGVGFGNVISFAGMGFDNVISVAGMEFGNMVSVAGLVSDSYGLCCRSGIKQCGKCCR